ncbi:MAG TPA: PA2169 family four-helix-bundle protein [Rhodanobacteraceae bacterium]|nr:PA2169 family four-helix-bundle protein [Rhodanobacteraceae bacterium]
MAEILATLRELAHICRDGERLYRQAATRMCSPDLREVAGEAGRIRGELYREFAVLLREHGQHLGEAGTLYGRLRKRYTGLRAHFADSDRIYVRELECVEDRLLHAMERATLHLQPGEVRALLRRHMPAARAAHERMSTLRRELTDKAAA